MRKIKVAVLLVRQLQHGFTKNAKVSPNLTVAHLTRCRYLHYLAQRMRCIPLHCRQYWDYLTRCRYLQRMRCIPLQCRQYWDYLTRCRYCCSMIVGRWPLQFLVCRRTGIIWHDLPQIATEAILLVLYPWRYPLWHVKSPKRSSGGKVLKSGNVPIAPFYNWRVYLVHLPLLYMQCVNPEMIFTARFFNGNVMDMVWGVGKCRTLICILWAFCII